jgi:hypothetical protein
MASRDTEQVASQGWRSKFKQVSQGWWSKFKQVSQGWWSKFKQGRNLFVVGISSGIFLAFFGLAIYFTDRKFPTERLFNSILVWILAYSVYVAVLCGLAVLMVELVSIAYNKSTLGWSNGHAFTVYLFLTIIPVVGATFWVSEEAVRLIGLDETDPQMVRSSVLLRLEILAPLIVGAYLLADLIGWRFGKYQDTYRKLWKIDLLVLIVHILAFAGLLSWVLYRGTTTEGAQLFVAGAIGIALCFQNLYFGFVTSLRRD